MNKDNIIAGILSFFIPGLGQFYQGRNKDALWFFIGWIISIVLCVTLPFTFIVWIWSIIDAALWQTKL